MRHALWGLVMLLLAMPAAWADDKPKVDKADEKAKQATPKERYAALQKEHTTQQQQIFAEARKVKGEEQQKLFQKYMNLNKEFADKFFKLAEDAPKDPAGVDALFWVLQNGNQSSVFQKAADKVKTLVAEMPLADLAGRLNRVFAASPVLMEAVFKRAEKDAKEPKAADLLAWIAERGGFSPVGQQAAERLAKKHPDHPAIERACAALGRSGPRGEGILQSFLKGEFKPRVKAQAALALGQSRSMRVDQLSEKPEEADKAAAEAEKYYTMVVDEYGKDAGAAKTKAEQKLKALRTMRVGKTPPDMTGVDQDGKKFALSDYKGKVVLLDFWSQF